MPTELYMYTRCASGRCVPSEDELRKMIASHGLAVSHLTTTCATGQAVRISHDTARPQPKNAEALSRHLRTLAGCDRFPDFATGIERTLIPLDAAP